MLSDRLALNTHWTIAFSSSHDGAASLKTALLDGAAVAVAPAAYHVRRKESLSADPQINQLPCACSGPAASALALTLPPNILPRMLSMAAAITEARASLLGAAVGLTDGRTAAPNLPATRCAWRPPATRRCRRFTSMVGVGRAQPSRSIRQSEKAGSGRCLGRGKASARLPTCL